MATQRALAGGTTASALALQTSASPVQQQLQLEFKKKAGAVVFEPTTESFAHGKCTLNFDVGAVLVMNEKANKGDFEALTSEKGKYHAGVITPADANGPGQIIETINTYLTNKHVLGACNGGKLLIVPRSLEPKVRMLGPRSLYVLVHVDGFRSAPLSTPITPTSTHASTESQSPRWEGVDHSHPALRSMTPHRHVFQIADGRRGNGKNRSRGRRRSRSPDHGGRSTRRSRSRDNTKQNTTATSMWNNDWHCCNCGVRCFGSKSNCFKCHVPRHGWPSSSSSLGPPTSQANITAVTTEPSTVPDGTEFWPLS